MRNALNMAYDGDMSDPRRLTIILTDEYEASCAVSEEFSVGEIFHVARNHAGGANSTPIARYYVHKDMFDAEGFHDHWRIDCYVKEHALSPRPLTLGKALVAGLIREELFPEPMWLSVHRSKELEGRAFGEVFDLD